MIGTILSDWLALWSFVLVVGVLTAPVEAMFGPEKQTISSRFRWAFFWSISLLVTAASAWLLGQLFRLGGVKPLLVLDLRGAGEIWHPALRIGFLVLLTIFWAFVYDFCYYWYHRMQHAVPILWRFHAVHHSIEELSCLSSGHHWSEGLLHGLLLTLPMAMLIELRFDEIAIIATIVSGWTLFVHTNSSIDFGPLRWLFVSPRFHRLHHSLSPEHFDRNFAGVFPIIDIIFRTGIFPEAGKTISVGLINKNEPKTLREFLFALRDKS